MIAADQVVAERTHLTGSVRAAVAGRISGNYGIARLVKSAGWMLDINAAAPEAGMICADGRIGRVNPGIGAACDVDSAAFLSRRGVFGDRRIIENADTFAVNA